MLDRIDRRIGNFSEMSPGERRVAIAQDVLTQLELGHISADSGRFFERSGEGCRVCAIGALAVSVVDGGITDLLRYDVTSGPRERLYAALSEHFDRGQLGLIEAAFEMWHWAPFRFWKGDRLSERGRLRGIMENIVRNDGEFAPQQLDWCSIH